MATQTFAVVDVLREYAVALTVTRRTSKTTTDGHVAPNTAAVNGVTGHMQPLSPQEMRMLPEGENTVERWHVWSETLLQQGDLVSGDGGAPTVRIVSAEQWGIHGGFYHMQGVVTDDDLGISEA